MTRRILLHVGSPKCGSTYLQQVMLRNAPTLLSHGIRYPHDGGNHPGNASAIGQIDAATLQGYFADGAHTVVLSHEDNYANAKRGAHLAGLIQGQDIDVQIIALLRPFSEFVFGDYSQFMKQFFEKFLTSRNPYDGQTFRAFALRRVKTLKPMEFLRNWQRQFPETPLILAGHRHIPKVMTGLLGTDIALDWEVPRHHANPSLRMQDCDQLARAMRDPEIPEDTIRTMFKEAFGKTERPDPGRRPKRINLIETAFAPQNAALLETFGYDNRLPGYPRDDL